MKYYFLLESVNSPCKTSKINYIPEYNMLIQIMIVSQTSI